MTVQVIAYACAHFGKSLLWHCSGLIFLFYLTEVVGFEPAFAGALLAASLILSALCDLAVGLAIGAGVQSLRAAVAAQALGSIAAAVAFAGFAAVGSLPADHRAGWAIAGLMAFRVGYALLDVPQNAILAFATRTDTDRVRLTSVRYAASGAALLTVAAALTPWVSAEGGADRAAVFAWLAAWTGALTAGSALALVWAMRERAGLQPSAAPEPAPFTRVSVSFAFALASIVAYSAFASVFSKLEAYLVAFALPVGGPISFMVAVALGQMLAQPAWAVLGARLGLLGVYRVAAAAMIAATAAFAASAQVGGPALLAAGAAYGASASGMLVGIWSCLAASAARDPAKTTLRFGQFTFCAKLAQASAAAALGLFLQGSDYAGPDARAVLVTAMATGPLLAAAFCLAFSWAPKSVWGLNAKP